MGLLDIASAIANPVSSIVGGLINANQETANREHNDKNAQKDRELQLEFAKNGISWTVDDARKAGIHPLAALGANVHSASPTAIRSDPGVGLSQAGTGVADAMMQIAIMNSEEDLQKKQIENELRSLTLLDARREHHIKNMQENQYLDYYRDWVKNPMKYLNKNPQGATPDNPLPLFRFYRDQLSNKVFLSLMEEFAEGGEGAIGSKFFYYGNVGNLIEEY